MLEYNGFYINCLYNAVKRTFKAFVISKGIKRYLIHATGPQEQEIEALAAAQIFINSQETI